MGLSPGSWCGSGSAADPIDLNSAGPSQTPLLPAGKLAAGKKLDFGVSLLAVRLVWSAIHF